MAPDDDPQTRERPMTTATTGVQTPWLTRREAAEYVRVSLETFDRWVAAGKVRKHKVADIQSVRFHREELDALMIPVQSEQG
jgi:excisionase family DNA binding protein